MEWYGRSQAESIRVVDRANWWGSDLRRPRVLAAPEGCSRWSGQATDVSVAQTVVDQGEQLAGGGPRPGGLSRGSEAPLLHRIRAMA